MYKISDFDFGAGHAAYGVHLRRLRRGRGRRGRDGGRRRGGYRSEFRIKTAGLTVGLAAAAGAIGMGIAIAKSVEGISRQPEAESKIRTSLMLGLVFVETAIIYALIIAVLIIFVL